MSVFVCGVGIVSAIGLDFQANYTSLVNAQAGIQKYRMPNSTLEFPLGRIKLSNLELKKLLGINEDRVVSRTALLGLNASRQALEDAQIPEGARLGFVNATSVAGMDLTEDFYVDFLKENSNPNYEVLPWHKCHASTEFIAQKCGITCYRTTLSTACSSSLNAVLTGINLLNLDMLDYVVVGGSDCLSTFVINGFNSLKILDNELCCPLDRDRNGLNLGEGSAYVVLTKKDNTKKQYCEIVGSANANDCFHQTASSADGVGAYLAMQEALKNAKIQAENIDYVNMHGTGTVNNDASELAALSRLFPNKIPYFSSTKTYTAHTLAASGSMELVYSIMSIIYNKIFPNLRFKNPISPYNLEPVSCLMEDVKLEYVMTNSFGFGGNCSSLLIKKI